MSQEAIEKAVTEAATNSTSETNEESNQETQTLEQKEGEETSKKEESDKSGEIDKRTKDALDILEALEDPRRGRGVVLELMKSFGIDMPETKKEVKETEKSVKQLLKESLGDDFDFISDKLGDALENILTKKMKEVESKVVNIEHTKAQRELQNEFEKFLDDNKVTDEEAGELNKLVDEIPPSGNIALSKYLGRLLKMHRAEAAEKKLETETRQRQKKNLDQRVVNSTTDTNESTIRKSNKPITPREAVLAALKGEKLD